MKLKLIYFISMLFMSGVLFGQTLSPQVISSSGNNSASLCWTVGQIANNTLNSSNKILTQGFQQSDYKVISSVESVYSDNGITFYPNPTNNLLNIYSKIQSERVIELYDTNGKLIYRSKFKQETQIDLSKLNADLYLLKIDSETFKIIKQ